MSYETIYIAGPMRGISDFNFPAFDEAEAYLRSLPELKDWEIISPANIDRSRGIEDTSGVGAPVSLESFQSCMRIDLAIVARSHAVFLMKGWEGSEGANDEVFVANTCGVELWIAEYDEKGQIDGHYVSGPIIPPKIGSKEWQDTAFHGYQKPFSEEGEAYVLANGERHVGEVRVTDPLTGGQKGSKPAQLGSIDPVALLALARVGGMGAEKYERGNYLKGYKWSLSTDAADRHLLLFEAGENLDRDSGIPHTAHAAWNLLALTSYVLRGLGTDDRPPPADPEMLEALVMGYPLG
jgi:Domain of unknown function (DUF5664)/Domain of unknown function (DUF4406)